VIQAEDIKPLQQEDYHLTRKNAFGHPCLDGSRLSELKSPKEHTSLSGDFIFELILI